MSGSGGGGGEEGTLEQGKEGILTFIIISETATSNQDLDVVRSHFYNSQLIVNLTSLNSNNLFTEAKGSLTQIKYFLLF